MTSFYTFENRVIFPFKQKMFKLFLPYNKCKTICRVQKKKTNKLGRERKDFCRISDLVLSDLLFHPHYRPFFTTMPYDIYKTNRLKRLYNSDKARDGASPSVAIFFATAARSEEQSGKEKRILPRSQ